MTASSTVAAGRLAPALVRAARIIPSRSTIPVALTVKLAVDAKGLRLAATDFDTVFEEQVDDIGREDWGACLDAARLAGFVGALPRDGELRIEADQARVEVRSGRAVARMPVLPPGDFPVWRRVDNDVTHFEIGASELSAVIAQVGHAMCAEEARYYLVGICLHGGDPAVMVATDGHRLMRRRLSVALPPDLRVIIPRPTCEELPSLLRGSDAEVRIGVARNSIEFACDDWLYRSKIVDGTYPDYPRILPGRVPDPAVVSRTALAAAVARVRQVAHDHPKCNAIVLTAVDGELSIAAKDETHSGEDAVPLRSGALFPLGVQNTYLAEALAALPAAGEIELHSAAPHEPLWLCAVGEAHDGIVVMPMRV